MESHRDRFPRPDSKALSAKLESLADDQRAALWQREGLKWLSETATALGSDFNIQEVGCFRILSNRKHEDIQRMGRFLLNARKTILADLQGIASDPVLPGLAVLWLENADQYYEYVSPFYPETGEFGLSGGMFLRSGFPHLVFPQYEEIGQLEHVIAHELTHALLGHLSLPLWLDEGMAVLLEENVAGESGVRGDPNVIEELRAFWNADTIQEFWSGEAFARSDEGRDLSYVLARLLVVNLGHDYAMYRAFVLASNWQDAGEAAARQVLGMGLGDLIGTFLEPGSWAPDPTRWVRDG